MPTIAIWLASLLPSLAARVLASLGFGLVTVAGISVALDAVKDLIVSNLQGAPASIVGLLSMAGIGQAFGILFGGFAFVLAYHTLMAGTRLVIR